MAVDFKNSISDPIAVDTGNKTMQGMTVSKTIKLGSFTTNENAVWAAKNQLQKESFPFASISIQVNRDMFRLQVGDTFKFSYSKYSIVDMVCRILQIEEENLDSENITIHAMEDVFSISNVSTEYTAPVDNAGEAQSYTAVPILYQTVIEAPYSVVGNQIGIIPLAARSANNQIGYLLYMSSDGGSSYSSIGSFDVFCAYGVLVKEYTSDTYQIDDIGMVIDFVNDDIDGFESLTRQEMLGIKNLAIIGNEIMTIQTITPISGGAGRRYQLTGVYRGRFDTERESHSIGDGLYLINGEQFNYSLNSDLLPDTDRKFKFVPYNVNVTGAIADSLVTDLTISSRSRIPYDINNFRANGNNSDPVYYDDVDLTWSSRIRGTGAGVYAPITTDKTPSWEGYYEIEVYVSSVLVRTATVIDAESWTYTEAMNVSDNGSLASEIVFKISNIIDDQDWASTESSQEILTVRRG